VYLLSRADVDFSVPLFFYLLENHPDVAEEMSIIRERYTSKLLPILMVTTENESKDNETAHMAGVDLILHKPFNEETLGEAIEKVLKKAANLDSKEYGVSKHALG